jgi:hypothetical protein
MIEHFGVPPELPDAESYQRRFDEAQQSLSEEKL